MAQAVNATCRALLLLAALAFPSIAFGHRLDECLQAMLVSIEPGDILLKINIVPGVEVAGQVLALIDRDGDGVISAAESAGYAESFKGDLNVRLDGRAMALNVNALNFPEAADLRTGSGLVQLEYRLAPASLAAGAHRLTLENRHLGSKSVYLINAALPKSPAVQVTSQTRNENQSAGEIGFTCTGNSVTRGMPILWGVGAALFAAAVWFSSRRRVNQGKL